MHIPFDNLESIHDDVYIAVGGDGSNGYGNVTNMGTTWYIGGSFFDPIFWMDHAMVDRMLVIWQVLYPYSWIETHNGTYTWTISGDMSVNGRTRECS
jgi:hypothetical protein